MSDNNVSSDNIIFDFLMEAWELSENNSYATKEIKSVKDQIRKICLINRENENDKILPYNIVNNLHGTIIIPNDITFKDAKFLKSLPQGIEFLENLIIKNFSELIYLPKQLKIRKNLTIENCNKLQFNNDNIKINKSLIVINCHDQKLLIPENLTPLNISSIIILILNHPYLQFYNIFKTIKNTIEIEIKIFISDKTSCKPALIVSLYVISPETYTNTDPLLKQIEKLLEPLQKISFTKTKKSIYVPYITLNNIDINFIIKNSNFTDNQYIKIDNENIITQQYIKIDNKNIITQQYAIKINDELYDVK